MAWGFNDYGQLGEFTSLNISNIPVKVGLANIERLAGGSAHSLGVKIDGTAYAWGRNYYGALGTGSRDEDKNYTPRKLNIKDDLGNPIGIVEVAGGEDHSVALTQLGTVWTWGGNSEGQLGEGTTENNFSPTEISNLRGITAIAAGKDHTLALKDDGTVWTWGDNSSGQLGDNTQTNRSQPIQVPNLNNVKAIAAGDSFSVALKSDGSVWVWGQNKTSKTLGIGNNYGSLVPAQVLVSEGGSYFTGVSAIAAGNNHLLALCQDGSVLMWGIEHLYNSDVVIPYPRIVSFPTV
jgi:alpha-tubulin suppressor-like RCC1 family protein